MIVYPECYLFKFDHLIKKLIINMENVVGLFFFALCIRYNNNNNCLD